MTLNPIFDPEKAGRPMRVAAFMSGSGTNVMRLLEHEEQLRGREKPGPFETVFIFSDRSDGKCAGEQIALDHGLPYFSHDIRAFHKKRGLKRSVKTPEGLAARKAYDRVAAGLVDAFEVDVIALGGYMSYITLNRCVNVHPADLSIRREAGRRKFVGDHAVRDAISAGESTLRASTLWTDEGVDTGPLLMVSAPLEVDLPEPLAQLMKDEKRFDEVVDEHQERLKAVGDWRIFPKTIEMIAQGRIALDEAARVYVDQTPVPDGYRE
ncbi:MAG: formyltransferase family protein [Deltaproteobacteria bacterium]|nr:formyltransferase family protein [Deltaproteobacteria bacterium]